MDSGFLQAFLLLNVFLMGSLAAVGIRHAYAHFKNKEPKKGPRAVAQTVRLPADVREHLLDVAQDNFQKILDKSASELTETLGMTSSSLTKKIEKLGEEIVTKEMEQYRADLEQLRLKAEAAISGSQAEVAEHKEQLKAQLQADITAEKERLLAQIDTKIADAMASFLTEAMQHEVDLGAQTDYLIAQLEQHKDELKKGVSDEA